MDDNLKLWDSVQQTDPQYTSKVTGKAFNGTSINPMYLTKKATEHLGPMGEGWGVESICSETETIGDVVLFSEQIRLWYMRGEKRCEVSQWSSIKVAYTTNAGKKLVDEEARKKCRTNATSKCLSLLGFSADVWLKYYESPEYVNQMKVEHERDDVAKENAKKYRAIMQTLTNKCGCETDEDKLTVCQWVLLDLDIDLGMLKISPQLTEQVKDGLASAKEAGVAPNKILNSAKEWKNGNSKQA